MICDDEPGGDGSSGTGTGTGTEGDTEDSFDGTETDGETEFETALDTTEGGVFTEGLTEDDTGFSTEGETEGSDFIVCDPDNADFGGGVVAQAGISINFDDLDCVTVTGGPPEDQIVIDDFGSPTYDGSGSAGLTVISMVGGDFSNEVGFYLLTNMVSGEGIIIQFQRADGTLFTVSFTIQAAAGGDPARLVNVQVAFC